MYAELQVSTHFSFLRGASGADELFAAAAVLGLPALGICDRNSLAGVVRAHEASKATGVLLVLGCRLDLADAPSMLVYPIDRAAYGRLCRLLTIGKARAGKGACHLAWEDLAAWSDGLIAILLPDTPNDGLAEQLTRFRKQFGNRAYLALTFRRRPNDAVRLKELSRMAAAAAIPTVATGDVLYHSPERRMLQQVMTCIRERCTIDQAGYRLERTADRHLKGADEIAHLIRRYPDAIHRSMEIVERCRFSLDELKYQYPSEVLIPGLTLQEALEKSTWEAAPARYPDGVPPKVATSLRHEFKLIDELGYSSSCSEATRGLARSGARRSVDPAAPPRVLTVAMPAPALRAAALAPFKGKAADAAVLPGLPSLASLRAAPGASAGVSPTDG